MPKVDLKSVQHRGDILAAVSMAAEKFLSGKWQDSIEEVIGQLGQAVDASRVYIFTNHKDDAGKVLTSQNCEWVGKDVESQIDNPDLQDFSWSDLGFNRWIKTLGKGEVIKGNVTQFPEQEKEVLLAQGIKSILAVPIIINKNWWGFIGFDECRQEREWTEVEVDALEVAARILGAAVKAQLSQQTFEERTQELEKMNKLMVDRELKMAELKRQLKKQSAPAS